MADSGGWAYGSGGNQSVSPSSTTANWGSLGSNTQNYPPDGMGTRPVPNPSRISTAGESVDNYNWNMNHFMTTPSASVQVRNRSASGSVPFRDAMGLVDELFPGNPDHGRFGQYPGTVEISTSDTDEGNTGVEDSQNESKGKRKSKDRSKGKSDPRYSKSSKK
ncbi:hypothetical protein QQZ08_000140 [Neonectria magnoliae]|uniref:Uncharacterized protein n=1 Tax=Neonectria magnoliae TaxID=2732573 RepID=A0ABR1IJX9_9HYPO